MAAQDHVSYDAEHVKQVYAESYASFTALPGYRAEAQFLRHRFRTVLRLARTQVPAGATCIDLGCGLGIKTRILAEQFHAITGLDFVERCIQVATLLNDRPNLRYIQADATQPTGTRHTWATAFGLSLFNVHDPAQCAAAIAQCAQAHLQPGGTCIVYSFTDFSGTAPTAWVNHTAAQLKAVIDQLRAAGIQAQLIFPHRHIANYTGGGLRHLATEIAKLLSRKRRDYYIVLQTPAA